MFAHYNSKISCYNNRLFRPDLATEILDIWWFLHT